MNDENQRDQRSLRIQVGIDEFRSDKPVTRRAAMGIAARFIRSVFDDDERLSDGAELADKLREYNKWRRGEGEYAWSEDLTDEGKNRECPMTPKELGEVIDAACEILEIGADLKQVKEGEIKMTYENHSPHIARHYTNAKVKRPYFADKLTKSLDADACEFRLDICRDFLRGGIIGHDVSAIEDVFDCELAEVQLAIAQGNTSAAIEKCYDAVAVLLRVVDVLRGEQKLGNPDAKEA